MEQGLALDILANGHNVLLTGPAGSGKTYVLNKFIRHAKGQGKKVAVTATTGLAATHLNGTTIHSWSGIGIHEQLPKKFHEGLPKARQDNIKKTDVLVIDEVSMLHDYRLDMIDAITRQVRGSDKPFGGLQVVLCGDFFQLPPVNRSQNSSSGFVITSQAWEELDPVICYLSEQHRQDDELFLEILNAMRTNDLRRRHGEALLARRQPYDPFDEVTELHTTNINVDVINNQRLASLDEDEHSFDMTTSGRAPYVKSLKQSCLAQEELILKKGALVMCIKNNPDKKYVNGSLGTVIDFDEDSGFPVVELKNGRVITVEPETWELRDGDKKRASITQVPLRLAWAITVHKSQGMTLDGARVDLSRAFVEGMGYVALSRVKNLQSLSLAGINQMALRVSPLALEIDQALQTKAHRDAKHYEHLRGSVEKQEQKQPKVSSGSWNERLADMRKEYPNAYKPWQESEDRKLKQLFKDGEKTKVIADNLGRHPGSIRARLKKHYGEGWSKKR